jgi:hypothetical protein
MLLPASFVRPVTNRQPSIARDSFPSGRPRGHAKRIFIIRQTTSFRPTNSVTEKKVQHILIFDDHPDSLQLALGEPVGQHVDRTVPRRVTLWVVLFSMLMLGLLIAMFWPLF